MKRYRTILVTAALGLLLLPACERENLLGTLSEGISFTVTTGDGAASAPAHPAIKGGLSEDDFAAGTLAAVSLSGDLVTEEGATLSMTVDSRPMAFAPATSAPAGSVPPTKAAPYGKGPLSTDADLGLVAYTYAEANAAATAWTLYTAPAVTRFYNDKSRSDASSGKWIPASESRLLWPKEGFIRFFAYAPYTDSNGDKIDDNVTVTAAGGAAPTLGYTVKPVASQIDLLVADENSTAERIGDPGWRKIDVTMNMLHALTGIRFRIIDGLTIESVKISGVYDKGDLSLSTFPLSWSNLEKSFAPQEPEYELTNLSLGSGLKADTDPAWSGYNVTDDAKTFLLLPQTLPASAKIEVTVSLKDGGTTVPGSERTITADIAGQEWKPGTMVTYTITHDGTVYVLEVLKDNSTYDAVTGAMVTEQFDPIDVLKFSYSGGLRPFSVTSYKISREGSDMKYEGVDWKLQMKKNGAWVDVQSLSDIKDGNNNAWVYDMPLAGVHSHLSGQTGANAATSKIADTVTIAALPSEVTPNAHTTTLRGFSPLGTKDAPVDLSLKSLPVGAVAGLKTRSDIARSTANCYVVDRPGWYKIPMVYGNALKDGNTNAVAYSNKVDHTGTQITQPWVSMSHDIKYVRLLWQDIPGLLTNISATGSGNEERYIVFYVDPATIHQGNAVVAAYATEEGAAEQAVAWSWHIWVTDADFSPVQVEGPDYTVDAQTQVPVYGLMRQDIGESAGIEKRSFVNPRNGEFRLVQVEGGAMVGKTKELKLIQKGVTTEDLVNDVYHDVSYACYALTYQWGRKDPLFLTKDDSNLFVLWPYEYYGTVGGPTFPSPLAYLWDGRIANIFNPGNMEAGPTDSYADIIKDPQLIVESRTDMAPFLDFNHWDNNPSLIKRLSNQTIGNIGDRDAGYFNGYARPNLPVKTVYDPSPLGWCVPPPGMVQRYGSTPILWGLTFDSGMHDYNQSNINATARTYTTWKNTKEDFIEFNSYYGVDLQLDAMPRWCCSIMSRGNKYSFPHFRQKDGSILPTVAGINWFINYDSTDNHHTPYHQKAIRPCQETMSWTAPNGTNPNEGGYTHNQNIIDGWF